MSITEPSPLPLTLGSQLASARRRFGVDQQVLGAMIGVDRSTVSRWERDRGVPDFRQVVKISDLTGWPLDLFARAEVPEDDPNTTPDQRNTSSPCTSDHEADVLTFRPRAA